MAIDRTALRKLRDVVGGSDDDLMELIRSFLEEAPELVTALKSAGLAGDLSAARRAAHSLKSNCRDFGALQASSLLGLIEARAADGSMPEEAEIAAACAEVEGALRELEAVSSQGIA